MAVILTCMNHYQHILTVWSTAEERCQIVWTSIGGYQVRVWLRDDLTCEEFLANINAAIERALDFQISRPAERCS